MGELLKYNNEISFLKKSALLLSICLFFSVILFYMHSRILFYMQTNMDTSGIYVWGDSRAYAGIDIDLLRKEVKKKIFNYSQCGTGPYDFLVFSNDVPRNSTIILGLSEAMYLRGILKDRSCGGLVPGELFKLKQCGYDYKSVYRIYRRNLNFKNNYSLNGVPYAFYSTIRPIEWDKLRTDFYSEDRISIFKIKEKIFYNGMIKLKEKNCNVHIFVMPI